MPFHVVGGGSPGPDTEQTLDLVGESVAALQNPLGRFAGSDPQRAHEWPRSPHGLRLRGHVVEAFHARVCECRLWLFRRRHFYSPRIARSQHLPIRDVPVQCRTGRQSSELLLGREMIGSPCISVVRRRTARTSHRSTQRAPFKLLAGVAVPKQGSCRGFEAAELQVLPSLGRGFGRGRSGRLRSPVRTRPLCRPALCLRNCDRR